MSVTLSDDGVIELNGVCTVEDADVLLQFLVDTPKAIVDWRNCESAHTAVIQILLAAKSDPVGPPSSDLLKDKLAPLLRQNRLN